MAGGNPTPAKRDRIKGWSQGAVRRHTKWLYSIDPEGLDGEGWALSLTMRDCPGSAEEFAAARRAWIKRVERMGALRIHWVVEWQRRGVPHIHAAVYFPPSSDPDDARYRGGTVALHWIEAMLRWSPRIAAQHAARITGATGWLKYLSKHAARGVEHYQRQGKPAGWESTGRLWGKTGSWPEEEPLRFDMSTAAYQRYRRLVRSWRCADARVEPDLKKRAGRIAHARRMLACSDPRLSAVRGVSDWTPEPVTLALVGLLIDEGHRVVQR